ncbi:MAG TPA: restriction endonuclease [Armatimonadota bacterium]|jgi:inner membrane protein
MTPFRPVAAPDPLGGEILSRLSRLSYRALEECIAQLIGRLGFQDTTVLGRAHLRQRTSHGGYDLRAAHRTGITTALTVIQLKQYERPVGRRFVDELRGAMLRANAAQGILVSLSSFSQTAVRAASAANAVPVRLIGGEELATLLARHGVGLLDTNGGGHRLDELYFAGLDDLYPPKAERRSGVTVAAAVRSATGARPNLAARNGGEMMFRTHAMLAVSSLWLMQVVPPGIGPATAGTVSVTAVFGAMLPDLDASESVIRSIGIGGVRPFDPMGYAAHSAWGHRGPLHSTYGLAAILVAGLLAVPWWGWQPSAALWIGYASHLAADACTRSGIPFLPWRKRRFHLLPKNLRLLTGSQAEDLLLAVLAVAAMALLFSVARN